MKKLFVTLMILGACLLVGCGKKEENIKGTLEELMTKVYADIPDDQKPMMLENIAIDKENEAYYLGSEGLEYEEAIASESMTGSIAHSVVLVRAKEGADVEAIEDKIEETIDPRKWICVGVEPDDVVVENKGNLILLLLVENEEIREKLETNFENLK